MIGRLAPFDPNNNDVGLRISLLNGDGKAEVVLKIADGVKVADGTVFSKPNPPRQFIPIVNGQTGTTMANRAFPVDFLGSGSYGTQLGIGYLDGVKPSIIGWLRNRTDDKSFNDIFLAWTWSGETPANRGNTRFEWGRRCYGLSPNADCRCGRRRQG